jgi:CubicO group peptidase (beta-lactamase class C family)
MTFRHLTSTLLFLVFICCVVAGPADAQTVATVPTGVEQLPDNLTGKVIREWFDAVNSGSQEAIDKFVDERISANARRFQMSSDQYKAYFAKLYKQSGGIDIVRVDPMRSPQPFGMLIKSRTGDHYGYLTAGLDGTEKDRLAGISVDKAEAPGGSPLSKIDRSLSEKEMISEIEKDLSRRAAAGDLSGVVLIAKGDRILLSKAYGMSDREAKVPVTLHSKFHLASIGKMFTGVAIGQLVKAGKLSFEDTIEKVLPNYPNKEVAKKITIHQLLTHSAGLGTFFESPGFKRGKDYDSATDEIEVYADEKLFFEPGTAWRYSNAGFSLLGAVIERISGEKYLDYIRRHIFKPLGMADTYNNEPGKAAPNSSVFYTQSDADPLGLDPYIPNRKLATDRPHAFGGGFSTAGDMFKFLRAYRTGKLLGAELTEKMAAGKVDNDKSGRRSSGYGIAEHRSNGELVRGHGGGSRSEVEMLWDSGYTVIVMTNSIPPPVFIVTDDLIDLITKQNALRSR